MVKNSDLIYHLDSEHITLVEKMGCIFYENPDYNIFCNALPDEIRTKTDKYKSGLSEVPIIQKQENRVFVANNIACPPNATAFMFCKLECDETKELCAYIFARFKGKVWLDGKIIAAGNEWIDSLCKIRLEKGIHTLVIETSQWYEYLSMNIRISSLSDENSDSYTSLFNCNNALPPSVVFINNADLINSENPLRVMVIPTDIIKYSSTQKIIFLVSNEYTKRQFKIYARMCESVVITDGGGVITNDDELDGIDIQVLIEQEAEYTVQYVHGFRRLNGEGEVFSFTRENPELLIRETYLSQLDFSTERYNICLPEHYDENLKYPLFLVLSTERYSTECTVISKYTKQPIIVADVTARGVTMGSYVGEASILEALRVLKSRYSIDENRIYLVGHSNGAAAAWAMAQAYPHLFAGILLFSGYTHMEKLDNLNNMRVINISSPYEHMYHYAWELPDKHLREHKNYKGALIKGIEHYQLLILRGKEIIYDDLLRHSLNEFPREIDYYTTFNRHKEAYWVTIHSISFLKQFARLRVRSDENHIKIKAENVSGVTLTLPPYIRRSHFTVSINGSTHCFEDFSGNQIHFECNGQETKLINQPPICNYRKGTGILDVYLDSLQIITVDTNAAKKVAAAFARPSTNGFEPQIYTDYPVCLAQDIQSIPLDKNIVIVDTNSQLELLRALRELCPVHMTIDGYSYLSKQYTGDYCIMQVLPHPLDNKKTILYINTNQPKLYNKNLFTRKVIIPSYMSGIHPFLNNEILIYDEKHYYLAYETGKELTEFKCFG